MEERPLGVDTKQMAEGVNKSSHSGGSRADVIKSPPKHESPKGQSETPSYPLYMGMVGAAEFENFLSGQRSTEFALYIGGGAVVDFKGSPASSGKSH